MKKPNAAPLGYLFGLSLTPFLMAGCALYKNPSACEAQMRATVTRAHPASVLSVSHVGVGIGGSRVVIEGNIEEHAATPAHGASAVSAASAASAPEPDTDTDTEQSTNADSRSKKSDARPTTQSNTHPKKTSIPATAECTFNGETLTALRWLRPAEFVAPTDADEADSSDPGAAQR
jgi:hypothetical protein